MSESKALEFAEYMAKAAENYIDAVDHAAMKRAALDGAEDDIVFSDQLEIAQSEEVDSMRRLQSSIYEFRKRAKWEK